jgi:flavin-dependent dehydrogenase
MPPFSVPIVRRAAALIAGGGPAGAAAAIRLAQGGAEAVVVERRAGAHDSVCGGFLGWDSLAALETLGLDPGALGAQPIDRVRLSAGNRIVEAPLPRRAAGLSRRTLDEALLARAADVGAELLRGRPIRSADIATRSLRLDGDEEIGGGALFLATGKYELRGAPRVGAAIDSAPLGLRTSIPAPSDLAGHIELHLFDGGYSGLLVQDDGSANLCLSVARHRLKRAEGVEALIVELAAESPLLARRLEGVSGLEWEAVAGVPYGWRTHHSEDGVFRLGDRGAVIASLAGDGVAIALSSGIAAADAFLEGGPEAADGFQRSFGRRSDRPVDIAERLRWAAERRVPRALAMALFAAFPRLAPLAAKLTRID